MNIFKRLFCKHDYKFIANIYGDQINYCGGKRSVWKCEKCGKIEYGDYLYINDEHKDYKLCNELDKLYNEYLDKRYKEWQLLRSKTLNKMQADMRNLAYNGRCWYDIVLICEEERDDKYYYEKWLTNNGLKFKCELHGEKCTELNTYTFHIQWNYK